MDRVYPVEEPRTVKRRMEAGAAELVSPVGKGPSNRLMPSCVFDTTIEDVTLPLAFATETSCAEAEEG